MSTSTNSTGESNEITDIDIEGITLKELKVKTLSTKENPANKDLVVQKPTVNEPRVGNGYINPGYQYQVFMANENPEKSSINKFILDTGATKHIICNKSFFTDFKSCNKTVNWGKAKSI